MAQRSLISNTPCFANGAFSMPYLSSQCQFLIWIFVFRVSFIWSVFLVQHQLLKSSASVHAQALIARRLSCEWNMNQNQWRASLRKVRAKNRIETKSKFTFECSSLWLNIPNVLDQRCVWRKREGEKYIQIIGWIHWIWSPRKFRISQTFVIHPLTSGDIYDYFAVKWYEHFIV